MTLSISPAPPLRLERPDDQHIEITNSSNVTITQLVVDLILSPLSPYSPMHATSTRICGLAPGNQITVADPFGDSLEGIPAVLIDADITHLPDHRAWLEQTVIGLGGHCSAEDRKLNAIPRLISLSTVRALVLEPTNDGQIRPAYCTTIARYAVDTAGYDIVDDLNKWEPSH